MPPMAHSSSFLDRLRRGSPFAAPDLIVTMRVAADVIK
jgi:hypothetical protein